MLSTTVEYKAALESLGRLKTMLGVTPELKAIAAFLLKSADARPVEPLFPYVGDPADPRDRAVVEAHREYWQRFLDGEDIQESFYEL